MDTAEKIESTAVAQDEFVTVPATTLPTGQHVPEFRVSRFLCALGADGKAVSQRDLVPANRINYANARRAAEAAGYKLLTLTQSQALALNIASVGANWTGGEVGKGDLIQGIRKWRVNGPQDGNFVPPEDERRVFTLTNGETILDAAGNLYSWIFDDVQGDENGIVARAFAADSPAVSGAPFPSMESGVGWYPDAGDDWSSRALIRGGYWCSGSAAGVFGVDSG